MSIITFWGNNKKSVGQSLSAGAVAMYMAMEHNYYQLNMKITHMKEHLGLQHIQNRS